MKTRPQHNAPQGGGHALRPALPAPSVLSTSNKDAKVIERATQTLRAWESFVGVEIFHDRASIVVNRGDVGALPASAIAALKARADAAHRSFAKLEVALLDMPASTARGMLGKLEATKYRGGWLKSYVNGGSEDPSEFAVRSVVEDLYRLAGGKCDL